MAGVVALGLGWVWTGVLGIVAGVVAIVFGIIGLSVGSRRRGRAIVAIIFGGIAIAGYTAFYLFVLTYAPSLAGRV